MPLADAARAAGHGEAYRRSGATGGVEDQIELPRQGLADMVGAESAEKCLSSRGLSCRGIANQPGQLCSALAGELDRDAPDAAVRAGDEDAPVERGDPRTFRRSEGE